MGYYIDAIDDFLEKLEFNKKSISIWLKPEIVRVLEESNNYLNLILDNQRVIFNIKWDTMFLYEIEAKWYWTNLILNIIMKAIDNWLRYIKIQAKPLWSPPKDDYNKIEKYLFSFYTSFWFKKEWNSNYFTLDLDDEWLINVLNNKFDLYLETEKWNKL